MWYFWDLGRQKKSIRGKQILSVCLWIILEDMNNYRFMIYAWLVMLKNLENTILSLWHFDFLSSLESQKTLPQKRGLTVIFSWIPNFSRSVKTIHTIVRTIFVFPRSGGREIILGRVAHIFTFASIYINKHERICNNMKGYTSLEALL